LLSVSLDLQRKEKTTTTATCRVSRSFFYVTSSLTFLLSLAATIGVPYNEEIVVESSLNIRKKPENRQKRQFGGGYQQPGFE
jgi:hypothetical protein